MSRLSQLQILLKSCRNSEKKQNYQSPACTDKDTGCPASASVDIVQKIIPRVMVEIYENGSHGIYLTHRQQLLKDILGFASGLEL
ncbi:hypothetical protein VTO42DRAFT_1877 [Malbranchea cinnamomea]